MKALKNIYKGAGVMAAMMLAALPQQAHAATTLVDSTGLSDETLFIVMVVIAAIQLIGILVIAGVIKTITSNREIWERRWNKGAAGVVTLLLMLTATQSQAAATADFDNLVAMDDTAFVALLTINIVLLFAFVWVTVRLNNLLQMLMADETGRVPETAFSRINKLLTKAVPVERESEVEMDHEYDGIRELDNNLPPWWLWGFYFTIAFGVVYMVNYHITGSSPLSGEEYVAEMEAAAKAKAEFAATQTSTVDETNVTMLTEAAALENGAKTFKLYCAACHGESGGSMPGGVGPNLTDDYWLHGGAITDIYQTIKYGVPAKGMVSWEAQLSPTKIQEVASYIKSIYGTNPDNAKEPQGELWKDEAAPAEEAPAVDTAAVSEAQEITMAE